MVMVVVVVGSQERKKKRDGSHLPLVLNLSKRVRMVVESM